MGVVEPVRVLDAVEEPERVMRGRVLDVRAHGRALAVEPARIHSGALHLINIVSQRHRSLSSQGARYGIDNEGLIGLCFLPCGIGNISAFCVIRSFYSH